MMKYVYNRLFNDPTSTAEENTIMSTDLEPAISIDFQSGLNDNINRLREVLGISRMQPMVTGSVIKIYKKTIENSPAQVGEGEVIPLTKVKRTLDRTIELVLEKYRERTTAEAIQRVGRNIAINDTDAFLVRKIRKDVKKTFFDTIQSGTGSADAGDTLQKACANLWAALQTGYEDIDASPVFFVSPADVATYLGDVAISTQTAFGFNYIQGFLGMGLAIIDPNITAGTAWATVTENLNGAYVPVGGDVASTFGLTYDESGLVGLTHYIAGDAASVDTLFMSCVKFYPELLDGVYSAKIGG